jgi:hypothetical protein
MELPSREGLRRRRLRLPEPLFPLGEDDERLKDPSRAVGHARRYQLDGASAAHGPNLHRQLTRPASRVRTRAIACKRCDTVCTCLLDAYLGHGSVATALRGDGRQIKSAGLVTKEGLACEEPTPQGVVKEAVWRHGYKPKSW